MMLITAVSNVADTCVFYLDGTSYIFSEIVVMISGSWLYLANILIGYTWSKLIMTHLNIPFTKRRQRIYHLGGGVAVVLLVINVFYPVVFSVKKGIYQRGPLYVVFLVFALLYIIDSLFMYGRCRKTTGTLKLFPVYVFLIPVATGVIVQAFFVEIAITWTSISIAIAGIMTSLKNELIFMDRLTGLYNRVYLEFIQKNLSDKNESRLCGIMIDLNGFKQINDIYGHAEGDRALVKVSDILRVSFEKYGVVTRYAGDEFVVILNTADEKLVQNLIEQSKKLFESKSKDSPYPLSASMGYEIADLSGESVSDFITRIDKRMYQDKLNYYKDHDRRNVI